MIELYELRQFVVFADCGTLSEAAEVLHLSQPALSRNMKKLEEELGIPLFFRRKNRLELNENGTYVLGPKAPHHRSGSLLPGPKLAADTAA